MSEIYWMTRLNLVVTTCEIFMILGIIFSSLSFLFYCVNKSNDNDKWIPFWSKCLVIGVVAIFIFSLGRIFVPTTKEAMLIYGIGGSIDYLKTNDVAKQLPDKCINALDAWVESFNNTENQ